MNDSAIHGSIRNERNTMKNMDPKTREWLLKLGEEAEKKLIPLKERRPRLAGAVTAGQGKMCSFSGNV